MKSWGLERATRSVQRVLVKSLQLVDFRNYVSAELQFETGTTAVVGDNGQGKTNLAEALGYLATLDSFRGAPVDALIRSGADTAIIRAEVRHDDGRELLIEAEISRTGRNRVLVNRQRLTRSRELLGVLRVSVFSPDDLNLVKGGPGELTLLDEPCIDEAPVADAQIGTKMANAGVQRERGQQASNRNVVEIARNLIAKIPHQVMLVALLLHGRSMKEKAPAVLPGDPLGDETTPDVRQPE